MSYPCLLSFSFLQSRLGHYIEIATFQGKFALIQHFRMTHSGLKSENKNDAN